MFRRSIVFSMIIIMLISLLPVIVDESDAAPLDEPQFIIEMDQYSLSANVSGANEIVTFTGSITFIPPSNISENEFYYVYLIPSCDRWSVTRPPLVTFKNNTLEQDFRIDVRPTQGASSSIVGNLTINGSWSSEDRLDWAPLPPVFCSIIIEPFYRIDLQGITLGESKIGEWNEYTITVLNEGNAGMNVTLFAESAKSYTEVDPEEITVFVPEMDSSSVIFRVNQKDGGFGTTTIFISVESDEGENLGTTTIIHRTRVDYASICGTISLVCLIIFTLVIAIMIIATMIKRSKKKHKTEE